MTENVKHAETLRRLADVIRKHGTCAPAALDQIADQLQREAAGDGESIDLFAKAVPTSYVRSHGQDIDLWVRLGDAEQAPRPTVTEPFRNMKDGATFEEYRDQLAVGGLTPVDQIGFDNLLYDVLGSLGYSTDEITLTTPASAEPGEDDPGEFGAGIQPNPKARYWQERADFWRNHAIALGYVADDGTQRYPPADVDHATAMEGWHAAVNDASELFANAPDQRFVSRASRVVTWIKANRPNNDARGGVEAVFWSQPGLDRICHQIGHAQIEHRVVLTTRKTETHTVPLYTHPTPAALDAEKVRTMVRDAIVEEVLAHPDDAVVDGPDFADAVLARFDAARATTGAE